MAPDKHLEVVPTFGRNNMIEVGQHVPDTVHHSIKSNILLKRIGSRDVIVSVIPGVPDETSSHIRFAGHGQERYLKIKIGFRDFVN